MTVQCFTGNPCVAYFPNKGVLTIAMLDEIIILRQYPRGSGIEWEADRKENGSRITHIYIGSNVSGNTIVAGDDDVVKKGE